MTDATHGSMLVEGDPNVDVAHAMMAEALDSFRESQEVAATLPSDLPYVTRIIMADDIVSARRWEARALAGEVSPMTAVNLTGSFSRMDLAVRLHEQGKIGKTTLLRALPATWSSADPDDSDPRFLALWREAAARAKGTAIDREPLPEGEQLAIYRGQRPTDPLGIAWSLDREVADKFARGASFRVGNLGGVILTAKVDRADVLGYMVGRNEAEIIVDPLAIHPTDALTSRLVRAARKAARR